MLHLSIARSIVFRKRDDLKRLERRLERDEARESNVIWLGVGLGTERGRRTSVPSKVRNCGIAQYHHINCAVKSLLSALETFQT